eukprot:scaffold3951_cov258-Pinguiococcus_pyrenoidosus.AAC.8
MHRHPSSNTDQADLVRKRVEDPAHQLAGPVLQRQLVPPPELLVLKEHPPPAAPRMRLGLCSQVVVNHLPKESHALGLAEQPLPGALQGQEQKKSTSEQTSKRSVARKCPMRCAPRTHQRSWEPERLRTASRAPAA